MMDISYDYGGENTFVFRPATVPKKSGCLWVSTDSAGSHIPREVAADLHEQLGKWLEENPKKPRKVAIRAASLRDGERFTLNGQEFTADLSRASADFYVVVVPVDGPWCMQISDHQEVTVLR
jgi:hypothetical protein